MTQVDSMIGHNTSGTALHRLQAAVAGLGLALQDARSATKVSREQMIIVARYLVAVDDAAANDEVLADDQIRAAGITSPTDLIANAGERTMARWMARGGVRGGVRGHETFVAKTPNEINDLSPGGLNRVEGAFLARRKFAKAASYAAVFNAFKAECRSEIRKALAGESALSLDGIRGTYAGTLFKTDSIEGWIRDEDYKRSDAYQDEQLAEKAWRLRKEKARTDPAEAAELMNFLKREMGEIRTLLAQQRAEAEARKNLAALKPAQRRVTIDSFRRSREDTESADAKDISDEDF